VETLAELDQGSVGLGIRQDRLEIRISGRPAGSRAADFRQRLVDRAEAVGGSVQLEPGAAGRQMILVEFPIGPTVSS
jgi:hypothetical protein